jgi:hypothetical protein
MKTTLRTLVLIFLCTLPALALAKGPGSGQGRGPAGGTGMANLETFLSMSDEALEQLEATIHRIRQMTPEERQASRERIAEYRTLPAEEREQIQQAWGQLDASMRAAWREYMISLDPEAREKVRKMMHEIPAESRTNWRLSVLREHGLLPQDPPGEGDQ